MFFELFFFFFCIPLQNVFAGFGVKNRRVFYYRLRSTFVYCNKKNMFLLFDWKKKKKWIWYVMRGIQEWVDVIITIIDYNLKYYKFCNKNNCSNIVITHENNNNRIISCDKLYYNITSFISVWGIEKKKKTIITYVRPTKISLAVVMIVPYY